MSRLRSANRRKMGTTILAQLLLDGLTMTRSSSAFIIPLVLAFGGCDNSGSCPGGEMLEGLGCANQEAMSCRSRTPSLQTGVYGCITSSEDVGSIEPVAALPGFAVEIFASQPPPTPGDGLTPQASTESDAVGFYELGLSAGRYWICTSFRRCAQIDVPASAPLRQNYDFGAGPGW